MKKLSLANVIPGLLLLSVSLVAQRSPAPQNPNLLILMADDLGWNDVGYHGSEISTPNIDRLVREGVELDRFYAYPVCSPTRTALMTGRSPVSIGIVNAVRGFGDGLPPDEHLMPESFKAAGYQTFIAGKWHLGSDHVKYFPQNRGFDYFYGHLGGNLDYYTHVYGGRLDWQRNGVTVREPGYTTDLIVRETVQWLEGRDKDKPVLLFLSFNAPHFPLAAPPESIAKYEHLPDQNRRKFAATVDAMDLAIGKVLATLEGQGMSDNTLVLWLSDNGAVPRFGGSNVPLRGIKKDVFEGGIRVPAAMKWPGMIEAGTKSRLMITAHDLFPTLAAACGVEPKNTKPFYGENLWPALREGRVEPRGDVLIGDEDSWAVFHREWKYVSLIEPKSGKTEGALFRILEDPYEKNDVSTEHPDLAQRLQSLVDAFPKKNLIEGVPRPPRSYTENPHLQPAAEAAAR